MKFPKEVEYGNKEYKLKITTQDKNRLDQLATQMKWRLNEGNGKAIYYIGIDDDGNIKGISLEDYKKTITNFNKITKIIDANIDNINENLFENQKYYIINLSLKNNILRFYNAILIGPEKSGKSTIIGNLLKNIKDDGRGKSRQYVFNHKHEIFSGTTSSISIKNINIDNLTINFIDTPGKLKYKKTMISALCKYNTNLIILVINPDNLEDLDFYLDLIKFLEKDYLIVITNKDKNLDISLLKSLDKDKCLEISNTTRFGYTKFISRLKKFDFKILKKENKIIQICDILSVPNMSKIYTALSFGSFDFNKSFYLHTSISSKKIKFKSIFHLDNPVNFANDNQLITFTLNNDSNLINKSDIIISDCKEINRLNKINVTCEEELISNFGICMFNNQYLSVKIEKENDYYILTANDGNFINLDKKIFIKLNDTYFKCDLSVNI